MFPRPGAPLQPPVPPHLRQAASSQSGGQRPGEQRPGEQRPARRRPSARVIRRRRQVAIGAPLLLILVIVLALSGGGGAPTPTTLASRHPVTTQTTVALADTVHQLDGGRFSTGACMYFPPTAGDQHKTVFLDAGHGGIDPGAVGTTEAGQSIHEATETLPITIDVKNILRGHGYTVVMSRTTDSSVARLTSADVSGGELTLSGAFKDVAVRDICANLAAADVLVGIYLDAGSSPLNAGSVTTYDAVRPFSSKSEHLAVLVQQDVLSAMNAKGWQIPDDGVITDSSLGSLISTTESSGIAAEAASYGHILLLGPAKEGYFSTPSQMPGVIVEPLFVTDPFEGSIAADAADQQVVAGGIARAIEQYLTPSRASSSGT